MEVYTKCQRDIIGTEYVNCKGNVLSVTGVIGKKRDKTEYRMSCSECSKDRELFPKGSLSCIIDSIRSKRTICGCSRKYKWKEYQYVVRIKRRCDELGYHFYGFMEEYKGCTTKVVIFNPSTGNAWNTSSIQTFLLNKVRDPSINFQNLKERSTLPDSSLIERFMTTGRFLPDTRFERLEDNSWNYRCPACSGDEYVKQGLCSGVFNSKAGRLLDGKSCCRCHKGSYRWSADQRGYQVSKYLSPLGHKFNGWEDGYVNTLSNVLWECNIGHSNKTSFSNLKSRLSCKTCNANGFKPHLPASIYIVRWSNEDCSVLKFGITNKSVDSRVTSQKKKSLLLPKVLYEFYHPSGQIVLDCENTIKRSMDTGCDRELLPNGFTETVEDTPENLAKLLEIISTFNLN